MRPHTTAICRCDNRRVPCMTQIVQTTYSERLVEESGDVLERRLVKTTAISSIVASTPGTTTVVEGALSKWSISYIYPSQRCRVGHWGRTERIPEHAIYGVGSSSSQRLQSKGRVRTHRTQQISSVAACVLGVADQRKTLQLIISMLEVQDYIGDAAGFK